MSADHFSTQSAAYAQFRPTYPDALFEWLAANAPRRRRAWDCACGTGQASVGLAQWFDEVIATDQSAAQLAHAPSHPRIMWRVAAAEESGLADASCDLVTVAQAAHWFDLPRFWSEARRVLKPEGLIAVWSYGRFLLDNPAVAAECDRLYGVTLEAYWPAERRIVEAGYGALPFPFRELSPPPFELRAQWSLDQLMGYFASWSATARYRAATGDDPLPGVRQRIAKLMTAETLVVRWPLSSRVGVAN